MTLTSCEISPLSIGFTGVEISVLGYFEETLQIVMKDGSVYNDFISTGGAEDCGFVFGKPLNLNEIDYVQVGDVQLKVNV